jgi:hypothetical protein
VNMKSEDSQIYIGAMNSLLHLGFQVSRISNYLSVIPYLDCLRNWDMQSVLVARFHFGPRKAATCSLSLLSRTFNS